MVAAHEAEQLVAAAHDAVGHVLAAVGHVLAAVGHVLAAVGHVLAANGINFRKVRQRQPFTYSISSELTISKKIQ